MDCTRPRVLLVDDDPIVRSFLADNLTADGFDVLEAGSLVAARRLIGTKLLDLAVVDLGLPDGDGLELVSLVRRSDRAVGRADPGLPVIIVSGRVTELDRVRGFDRGADDYVVKPFSYPELLRRIRARLRPSSRPTAGARIRVGPLQIDVLARQAWLDGEAVALSNKEFGLLRTLASDPERVFTREELMRIVWGWAEPIVGSTRTLDGHAARLRRKLRAAGTGETHGGGDTDGSGETEGSDAAEEMRFVVNVWGIGYRLIDGTGT